MLKNYNISKQFFFINNNFLVFLYKNQINLFITYIGIVVNFQQHDQIFVLKFSKIIWQRFTPNNIFFKFSQNTKNFSKLSLMSYKIKNKETFFNTYFSTKSIIFKKFNFNKFLKFNWLLLNIFFKHVPIKIIFFLIDSFSCKFLLYHYLALIFLCYKHSFGSIFSHRTQIVLKSHRLLRFMSVVNLIKYNWTLL